MKKSENISILRSHLYETQGVRFNKALLEKQLHEWTFLENGTCQRKEELPTNQDSLKANQDSLNDYESNEEAIAIEVCNQELEQFKQENRDYTILKAERFNHLEKWLMYLSRGQQFYCWWWHRELGVSSLKKGDDLVCMVEYNLIEKVVKATKVATEVFQQTYPQYYIYNIYLYENLSDWLLLICDEDENCYCVQWVNQDQLRFIKQGDHFNCSKYYQLLKNAPEQPEQTQPKQQLQREPQPQTDLAGYVPEHLQLKDRVLNIDICTEVGKSSDYIQAIKCWLVFKGKAPHLNISNFRVYSCLKKELSWYLNLTINPQKFIKSENPIKKNQIWQYTYQQILPELRAFYEGSKIEQLSLLEAELAMEEELQGTKEELELVKKVLESASSRATITHLDGIKYHPVLIADMFASIEYSITIKQMIEVIESVVDQEINNVNLLLEKTNEKE